MGGWDAYGLAAPNDRLLCFVLTRRLSPSNSPWLTCAWVEHADTGQRYATLVPGGTGGTTPNLGLALTKLVDTANQADYFTYAGAPVPGLSALLPCGVPLRLVLDNAYQSPRFYALAPATDLLPGYLLLEWQHAGPLQGVPYGRGFRQQLYIDNAALTYLDPRQEKESTKSGDTGVERVDSLSLFDQTEFTLPVVPAYLAQALSAAPACSQLQADGQPWKLVAVKSAAVGPDGGRWTVTGTLENQTPLLRRGCAADPLPTEAYDAQADAPRGWRCGDASDRAPDLRPTGKYSCETSGGQNTGYALVEYQDVNPYSPTTGHLSTQRQADDRCPLPTYYSAYDEALPQKNDCPAGSQGSSVSFVVPRGMFTSHESQQQADQQAQDYITANAQAYANAHGACQVVAGAGSATYVPVYASGGCFTGQMVNSQDATDQRAATSDEQAQYGGGTDNYGNPCPG